MKAILKVIWFALAIVLQKHVTDPIAPSINSFTNKLNAYTPILDKVGIKLNDIFQLSNIQQVVFIILLFLGLDIISGDIKGLIKGPIKLAFNTILYFIGFSLVFLFINNFSISF